MSLKEDKWGNMIVNAAVNTIFTEQEKLRTSEQEKLFNIRKRWVWELIQNASDCCRDGEKIRIKIDFDGESKLSFSHDGKGFEEENLRSMVTQISSKLTDDTKTGQFGTGFITTTLLSPMIEVKSFLEKSKSKFSLNLNRTGTLREEIRQAVKKNIQEIEHIINQQNSNAINLETTFLYELDFSIDKDDSIDAINSGIDSLEVHMDYLLCFNPHIESISINDKEYKVTDVNKINNLPYESHRICVKHGIDFVRYIKLINFSKGTMAIPFHIENGEAIFDEITSSTTRLYCNFPLIGTENYPFPLVINSKEFSVEMDRDGIFESNKKNKLVVEESIQKYKEVLKYFAPKAEKNTFNLCKFNRFQGTEYKKTLAEKIDQIIFTEKLIKIDEDKFMSIKNEDGDNQIIIPNSNDEEVKKSMWTLFKKLPNLNLPMIEFGNGWREIVNHDLTLKTFSESYLKNKNLEEVKRETGIYSVVEWLNAYYKVVSQSLKNNPLNNSKNSYFIPNANKQMCSPENLIIVEDEVEELIKLWVKIDPQISNQLVYSEIELPDSLANQISTYSNSKISETISDYIHIALSKEEKNGRTSDNIEIFKEVLNLFRNKPDESEQLFPLIYKNRTKLREEKFSEKLNDIGDIISENNLSIDELKSVLSNEQLMHELLNYEGELPEELKKKFKHISKRSISSKRIVQEMIERSINNVFEKLKQNDCYRLPDSVEEWKASKQSDTVFFAEKEDEEVIIVIRPNDGNKIIFYEDKELSVLESKDCELWTDNGSEVREFTLGDILREANISVVTFE